MRADGRRSKKLKVAFHFLRESQAGWNCDECRKHGLERKRNCGFLLGQRENSSLVWTRKRLALSECPKSYIRAQSVAWIESYGIWKRFGGTAVDVRTAREVQAFLILEAETAQEQRDNETESSRPSQERRPFQR